MGMWTIFKGGPDEDMFKEMLRVMAQVVMEEELARHLGAERHERWAYEQARYLNMDRFETASPPCGGHKGTAV